MALLVVLALSLAAMHTLILLPVMHALTLLFNSTTSALAAAAVYAAVGAAAGRQVNHAVQLCGCLEVGKQVQAGLLHRRASACICLLQLPHILCVDKRGSACV